MRKQLNLNKLKNPKKAPFKIVDLWEQLRTELRIRSEKKFDRYPIVHEEEPTSKKKTVFNAESLQMLEKTRLNALVNGRIKK